eukprot:8932115-Ditylum_brightwellii.AAC.1
MMLYINIGSTYKGNWKQDKFDGYSIRTFPSGNFYTGNYQDRQSHGFGKANCLLHQKTHIK